jgi:hypothetical protein
VAVIQVNDGIHTLRQSDGRLDSDGYYPHEWTCDGSRHSFAKNASTDHRAVYQT